MSGKKAKPGILHDMEIDEISLVDDGANQFAKVVLMKRRGAIDKETLAAIGGIAPRIAKLLGGSPVESNSEETDMDLEQLQKALEAAEAKQADFEKQIADQGEEITKLKADVSERDAKITDLEKAANSAGSSEDDDEAILKALPEPLRKRLEAAEAESAASKAAIQKMLDDQEAKESIAKAKEIGVGDPEKLGPLLNRVAKGKSTEADAEELTGLLKGVAAAVKDSKLFKQLGHDAGGSDGDALGKLQGIAKSLRAADSKLSQEEAFSKAMEQNPELYAEYRQQAAH